MLELILPNITILAGIALFSALVLYFAAKKFVVIEDTKIDDVEKVLPTANCGACGKVGCRDFASACVSATAEEFTSLYCPVGGREVMKKVSAILGLKLTEKERNIAVLRCQGTCQNAPDKITYTGLKSCRLASRISVGKSGCPNGCLRFGDCVKVCKFGALRLDKETGMPVVDAEKCTSCGACVNTCPRQLYELRPKGINNQRVYVACSNKQTGVQARKNCKIACIACQKCTKLSSLIKVENNLSYIPTSVDATLLGAELAKVCPTKSIVYTGKHHE